MKRSGAGNVRSKPKAANPPREKSAPLPPPAPMKPRPRLFVALLVIFLLWSGFLIWMYTKTVYPNRAVTPSETIEFRIEPAEPESG